MTAREVELSGGAPWGFRMHGGADHNQPLRISRVNPGRKASLSGIREGDIISSINGRSTRGMNNADAHAMLRAAGPVLRLGLNEDREMSPRRRSIGKSTELKRPSQLLNELQSGRATPQAPVYATIRPPNSPQNRPMSSNMRSSLSSLPTALTSTSLVKSVASNEEPLRFHPTNPFYTTLPSNYTSASKLPLPNNKVFVSSLDKSKTGENVSSSNDLSSNLKSPSFFNTYSSGPSSLPHVNVNDTEYTNGYESTTTKSTTNDRNDFFNHSTTNQYHNESLPNNTRDEIINPFESKRNSDPFEKYLRRDNKINGKCDFESKLPNSQSETNFKKKEEIRKYTITEHKLSEVEEVKTIKKITLNGSNSNNCHKISDDTFFSSQNKKTNESKLHQENNSKPNERYIPTNVEQRKEYSNNFEQKKQDDEIRSTYSSKFEEYYNNSQIGKASTNDVVTNKPPVQSPTSASAPVQSPTPKRMYFTIVHIYIRQSHQLSRA